MMSTTNTEMDEEDDKTLIRLIKIQKGIWGLRDTRTRRNTHTLAQLWNGISDKMGFDKAILQKRWKSLLRRMKVEIQLIPSDSDIDEYQVSEFEYFEDMRFLIPVLQAAMKSEENARKLPDGNLVAATKQKAAAPDKNKVVELNLRNKSPNRINQSEDEAKNNGCKQFLNSLVFHAVHIPAEKKIACQIKIFQAISKHKPLDIANLVQGVKDIECRAKKNDSLIDVIDLESETFENVSRNSFNRNHMKYEHVSKLYKREKSKPATINNYEQLPSMKAQHQSIQALNLQNENINTPLAPFLFTYPVTPLIPHSVSAPPIAHPFVENNMFYPGQLLPSNNAINQLHMAQQQMQFANNAAVLQQLQNQQALYSNQNPYCTYQPVNIGLNPYQNAFIPQAATTGQQQLIDCDRMQFSMFAQQQHQQSDLSDNNLNRNQNSSTQVQAHQQHLSSSGQLESAGLHAFIRTQINLSDASSVINHNGHNGSTPSGISILTTQQVNSTGQRQVNVNNDTFGEDNDTGMADISLANQLQYNDQEQEDSSSDDMGQQEDL